jgi:hypothetical protein
VKLTRAFVEAIKAHSQKQYRMVLDVRGIKGKAAEAQEAAFLLGMDTMLHHLTQAELAEVTDEDA